MRRSRIERYLDILKVVARHGPIKQTHIMYKANLSWMELKRSLEHLTKSKMITEIDDSSGLLYAISETGLSTIYNYEKVEKILTGKDDQTILTSASPWNF
ncbi:MAG: winged helix-turn-helix domain-containing protein [Nitrososphaerales archaeon]